MAFFCWEYFIPLGRAPSGRTLPDYGTASSVGCTAPVGRTFQATHAEAHVVGSAVTGGAHNLIPIRAIKEAMR